MYGLIGKIIAKEGKREELAQILISEVSGMLGCKSDVIAFDVSEKISFWITEVWESKDKQRDSLSLNWKSGTDMMLS
jgi:quinol monooxygenase YgiN